VLRIAQRLYPDKLWHDLDIRAEADGGFAVSMHCHVADDMPLEEAHRLAEQVETQVRATLPEIHRVTIHTEPPGG
jgi:divalent metal cation (Fe/Co/Zn/Cd) transporter